MTVNEAAEAWGMTTDAVRKLIRRERIPAAVELNGGKAQYIIPDGTKKPEKLKPGVKPRTKEVVV